MIDQKSFLNDAMSMGAGRASMDIENNIEQVDAPDPMGPVAEGPQVAALGASLPKYLKGLLSRNTGDILDNARSKTEPDSVPVSEIESVLEEYAKRQESPDAVEIDRLMAGTETTEDLGQMLEIMGDKHPSDVRTHAEVAQASTSIDQVRKELEPLLAGTQQGLLTDKQLFGLRSLLVTVGEETTGLANKIVAGDTTAETMAQYQHRFNQMQTLYNYSRGQATEIARSLNQQKMIAKTLSSGNLNDLARVNEMWGSPQDIQKHAEMFTNKNNNKGVFNALEFMTNKANSTTKVALEYWKNNILSGVETHAVNVVSAGATNVWENIIIRPTAAGIGAVRSKITGNEDRVYIQETMSAMAGGWVGTKSGIKMMAQTLKTGDSQFGMSKDESHGEIHKAFGNAVGDLSTMSFRLLRAEDEFAKSIAFTQQMYALATRDGMKAGLKGDELNAHINQMLDSPPTQMYNEAVEFAQHVTFTNAEVGGVVGVTAQAAKTLVGKVPAFGFVMPFINTPANLLNYAIDTSPLATVSPRLWADIKKGGASADIAAAKMVTGVSLAAVTYQLYSEGILTGDGPADYEQARFLEESTGWKKQGVLIDGTWYSMDRLDPFSASMAMVANYMDKATYAKNPEDAERHMMNAIATLGEVSMDSTWMSSFSDFVEVAKGERDVGKWATNYATGFVPYSGLVKSVKKGVDPTARIADVDKLSKNYGAYLANKLKGQTPGLSEFVRPARRWNGDIVIPEGGMLAHMAAPIKTGINHKGTPAESEMIKNGVTPREPESIITVGPASFSLLSLDEGKGIFYDAYISRVGKTRRKVLNEIVKRDDYKALSEGPKGRKSEVLERGLASAQESGRGLFLTEDLIPLLEEHPSLRTQLTEDIGEDPVTFIQNLVELGMIGKDTPIKTLIKGVPIRSPINMPSEKPPAGPDQIKPEF